MLISLFITSPGEFVDFSLYHITGFQHLLTELLA